MKRFILTISFLIAILINSFAQNFSLIKDINSSKCSNPSCNYYDSLGSWRCGFVNINNVAYFIATDATHGYELWRSDGTAGGTFLVKDINPGSVSGNISSLTLFNGKIFFSAAADNENNELWRSDGTDTGTIMVKDINVGTNGSYPRNIIATSKGLFFIATDSLHGEELWKSDGTAGGTVLIKDILPGTLSSNISYLMPVNSDVCFFINPNYTGTQLWKSNGTLNGTDSIKSLPMPPLFNEVVSVGNKLFFGDYLGNLWVSGGNINNTSIVKNITSFGLPLNNMVAFGNKVFFTAFNQPGGEELWSSDGSLQGTVFVKDVTPIPDSMLSIVNKTVVGNTLYFLGANANRNYDLWKSDGTSNGTIIVKNFTSINEPAASLFNVNNNLYLSAYTDKNGFELWKSNGKTSGTQPVKDINAGVKSSSPAYLTSLNGKVLFAADTKETGVELWQSDGTDIGTTLVKDINLSSSESSFPARLTVLNNELYFEANDDANSGYQLWKTNGTKTGTNLIKTIQSSVYNPSYYGYFSSLGVAGNNLYIPAFTYQFGEELWKSDGTSTGTAIVKDIVSGKTSSQITFDMRPHAASLNNKFFFASFNYTEYFDGYDNNSGITVWVTDGSLAGTKSLLNTNSINNIIRAGNFIYFSDSYLWKSDGITTTQVTNAKPSTSFSYLIADSNLLYFQSVDNSFWRTDGTKNGTFQIANVTPSLSKTAVLNNNLFLSATDEINGYELWKTDGTSAGTHLVKDIYSGVNNSNINSLTTAGSTLYFIANDGINGDELWKSDGTTAGTQLVKNITRGRNSSVIYNLTAVGNKVCFQVYTATDKTIRLWESDGTKAGTNAINDQGLKNATITGDPMQVIGNQIYFVASTSKEGKELWVGNLASTGTNNTVSSSIKLADENNSGTVSPNPFTNSFRLLINSNSYQMCHILITDVNGKNIQEEKYSLNKGDNYIAYSSLSWLPGTYFIKVQFADKIYNSIKIIKQ